MAATDRLIRIASADDPRIDGFANIRERDLRRQDGRFIAEGTVVLRLLAEAHVAARRFRADAVLLLENRVAGLEALLDEFPADVPVYVADKEVMNAIAGFDIHRGVLALGRRLPETALADQLAALPEGALIVAAINIANHDNVGAIFRNAAAFGADLVLLDETCCDPLYRKALRVSVGAVLNVPYLRGSDAATLLDALSNADVAIWGLSPSGAIDIRNLAPARRMALLTGTEGEGLAPDIMARIKTARIAQAPGLDSLNAGTATGIALYSMASAMGRI